MSIDVRRAIEKNAYVTSVADLEKRGQRHVRVIKTSTIRELIDQAVENVQRNADGPMPKDEMVAETGQEFQRLLKEKQSQQSALEETQTQIAHYKALITDLNSRIEHQENEIASLRAQATAAASTPVVDEAELASERKRSNALEQEVAEKTAQLSELSAKASRAAALESELATWRARSEEASARAQKLESERAQHDAETSEKVNRMNEHLLRQERDVEAAKEAVAKADAYQSEIAKLNAEIRTMRESQPATESLVAELRQMREGMTELQLRNRELEMQAAQAQSAPQADTSRLEELLEAKMSQISTELSAKLSNMRVAGGGGGAVGGTSPEDIKNTIAAIFSHDLDGEIDSNLDDVTVKEKQSGGIAGNLARLKNLGKK